MVELIVAPLFTLLGVAIAALVAILNSRRETDKEDRLLKIAQLEQRRQAIADRTSTYLAATYHAVLSLRELAEAEPRKKPEVDKQIVWPTIDPVNEALVTIKVSDAPDIVAAATTLDLSMVELSRKAASRKYTRDEWREMRSLVIGSKPDRVVDAARSHSDQLSRQAEMLLNSSNSELKTLN